MYTNMSKKVGFWVFFVGFMVLEIPDVIPIPTFEIPTPARSSYFLSFTATMPPLQPRENTLNGLGRRLRSQGICPICVIVTPRTPQRWDSRREMCRLCAMNTAENEGHRRARLTLRLPPRAHKTCALCEQRYISKGVSVFKKKT